uniref:VWA domain-containing protein n=1 Tax=Chlorobium phaeovibrioides (strain DSM 265 / 1930) TaxID=290318 RepID=A4SCD7_CHLPM
MGGLIADGEISMKPTGEAMKKGYTHITVILDRSGSMASIRDDTIGGVNAFLEKQREAPGEATLTLVQFDSGNPYEVLRVFMAIGDVPPLDRETYVPRGGTPLLDALGRGINDIDASIGKLEEGERPERVVVAVVTDGQENSSEEFSKEQVEKMIKEKSDAGWAFIFLSADLAAIDEAVRLGFHQDSALSYEKSPEGMACCMDMLSERVMEQRVHPKKM